jgi:hypothetical protein
VLADFERMAMVMKAGAVISGAMAMDLRRGENGHAPAYEIVQPA